MPHHRRRKRERWSDFEALKLGNHHSMVPLEHFEVQVPSQLQKQREKWSRLQ
jgi:hypothetical protein